MFLYNFHRYMRGVRILQRRVQNDLIFPIASPILTTSTSADYLQTLENATDTHTLNFGTGVSSKPSMNFHYLILHHYSEPPQHSLRESS